MVEPVNHSQNTQNVPVFYTFWNTNEIITFIQIELIGQIGQMRAQMTNCTQCIQHIVYDDHVVNFEQNSLGKQYCFQEHLRALRAFHLD